MRKQNLQPINEDKLFNIKVNELLNNSALNTYTIYLKKGNAIHIKKVNKGKFTEYCGGKVTDECIERGKNSPDPKVRKRAIFAQNFRHK